MKKLSFFFAVTILILNQGFAQPNNGMIRGAIKDEAGNPLEFGTIMLLSAQDSSLVKGAISDTEGAFIIENVSEGSYRVGVTQVGFEKYYSSVFSINATNLEVNLPDIIMKEDVKLLNEITVETTKPFIEQEIDKMVINVENSIVSSGSNALEVLEKAPGVTIDRQNDQIQLKGKSGVIVLIDGKQTYLSSQDVSNLLKNTPSDNIEKIEVITNPSSKYDAAGNTGIINIRMKKNKNFGTNGTATVGAGYGRFGKANTSLLLNHRKKNINVFGNYSYNFNRSFGENEISRVIPFEGTVTYFDQFAHRPNQYNGQNYRAGFDYFINNKSTIGVLVTGFSNSWRQFNAENRSIIRNEFGEIILRPTTVVDIDNDWRNVTGNLNYKYEFDGKGRELTIDMDYSNFDGSSFNNLTTTYTDADFNTVQPVEIVRNTMPSNIDIWAIKADYVHLMEKGKLEAGVKSSYVKSDNNLIFENQLDNQWFYDESKSNHFIYDENINAAYVNFSRKLNEKTTIQGGLRVENTYSKGNSLTLNQVVERNYTNLFPTFFISRQLDSSNVVNVSYSRRIDRPNYQSLNPFVFYLDPYTYQQGNPYLQPQYTNSLQLTHVYKSSLTTTLGYSRTTDYIFNEAPGQIPEENITYVQPQNLGYLDNVNLTVSYPIKVRNWWNIQNNFGVLYNKFNSPYRDAVLDVDVLAWNAYISNNFILGNGFSAELSGWYNSRRLYGFYMTEPMGAFSLGLQKFMFDKKLTIKANINDPFWLNRFRGKTEFQDINLRILSRWESRVARITLTYNFGNQNVKGARQRSTGTEAERNRVGGGN